MGMKITADTIAILQNFASINNGLQVKAGNELKTISPNKTILASAQVSEKFEDFCVYELSQFLGTLSLFKEPEIDFHKDFAIISDGNSKVKYVYADPNTIVTVPDKGLQVDPSIKVIIAKSILDQVLKAANVLSLPNFVIEGDGNSVVVKATDVKNSTSNEIDVKLEAEACVLAPGTPFRMVFKLENLKIISDDYTIGISSAGIAEFLGNKAKYFIAVEKADSKI